MRVKCEGRICVFPERPLVGSGNTEWLQLHLDIQHLGLFGRICNRAMVVCRVFIAVAECHFDLSIEICTALRSPGQIR